MAEYDLGNIEISLDDPKSIDDAIMRINMIAIGIKRAMRTLHKYILEQGVEIAKAQLVRLCTRDAEGGPLYSSIKTEEFVYDESTGKGVGYITAGEGLKTGSDGMTYAVYVEYGTGLYSEQAQKAKQESSKATSWGATLKLPQKQDAAQDKSEPSAAKPMHFYSEEDNRWYTIWGQSPKKFMTNTMYELWSKAQKEMSQQIAQNLPHETE